MSEKLPPLTKHQKFAYAEIARSDIELAYYNPRKISEGNRKRLSKALTEHGLVEPLVWNSRTRRLVSGHQRITDLDSKHRGTDYSLGVAVVDVDEKQEAKLNVLLNNSSLQGVFDIDAVAGIGKSLNIDLGDFGFSREDLLIDFGFEIKSPVIGSNAPAPESTPVGTGAAGGATGSPGVLDIPEGAPSTGPATLEEQNKALMAAKFADRRENNYEASAGGILLTHEDDSRLQIVWDNGKDKATLLAVLGLEPTASVISANEFLDAARARLMEGAL